MKLIINTDGLSKGNPGTAAIGATIKDERGKMLATISQRIGITTNNVAEYKALIAALQQALKMGGTQVEIRADSELMIRQLSGKYKIIKFWSRLPGIGLVRATTLFAYLDTPWRFRKKNKLWKYCGVGLQRTTSGTDKKGNPPNQKK